MRRREKIKCVYLQKKRLELHANLLYKGIYYVRTQGQNETSKNKKQIMKIKKKKDNLIISHTHIMSSSLLFPFCSCTQTSFYILLLRLFTIYMKSPIVYLIMMSKLVFMRVLKVWALFFLGRKDRKVWAFFECITQNLWIRSYHSKKISCNSNLVNLI